MSELGTSVELGRRSFLLGTAAAGAGAWLAACTPGRERVQVYVLVVDGCRPDEITPTLMPRLSALRADGVHYPGSSSLPVLETIPNHVMMATGVRPWRNGVPANSVYDRHEGIVRELDRPADLTGPTVFDLLDDRGGTSLSVLSKEYLYGIFGTRASARWEPEPIIPVSGHAPDIATVDALIRLVGATSPDLTLCNLGDIDRFGHADATGPTPVQAQRRVGLAGTDAQAGRFLDFLESSGRWATSVVLVLADHSMDWSTPGAFISLDARFEDDPLLAGRYAIAQNGGADLLYWLGSSVQRDVAVARMRELALATAGVLSVHRPGDLGLSARAGDLIAYARPGWRFTDPSETSNPIPGNHGHPATAPIPFFIGGGSPVVRRGVGAGGGARTIDVAPTVAWLLGLSPPPGGWHGTARTGAFLGQPQPVG